MTVAAAAANPLFVGGLPEQTSELEVGRRLFSPVPSVHLSVRRARGCGEDESLVYCKADEIVVFVANAAPFDRPTGRRAACRQRFLVFLFCSRLSFPRTIVAGAGVLATRRAGRQAGKRERRSRFSSEERTEKSSPWRKFARSLVGSLAVTVSEEIPQRISNKGN